MWETITGLLPAVMAYVPINVLDPITNAVGVAAIAASLFAEPQSQWGRKARSLINLLGFNFGKAKNRD